ncbi:unnamed protein product, partial [Protopolystoma xenopodis]
MEMGSTVYPVVMFGERTPPKLKHKFYTIPPDTVKAYLNSKRLGNAVCTGIVQKEADCFAAQIKGAKLSHPTGKLEVHLHIVSPRKWSLIGQLRR